VNLIDILLGEHGVFFAMFDNLDGRVPKTERMGEVLSIARTLFAALASHTRLEDEILFTELEPHLGADGPLGVMREEHDEIHRTLDIARDAQQTFEGIDRLLHVLAVARPTGSCRSSAGAGSRPGARMGTDPASHDKNLSRSGNPIGRMIR
jgi:hypothetical protein